MKTTTANPVTSEMSHSRTTFMVKLALMVAIIFVMAFSPLGYLRTPGLTITFLTVPVAVGAIILGPTAGAICGGAFGLTSAIMALTGGSAFSAALLQINPFGLLFTLLVPRILEGWLCGLIFAALKKICKPCLPTVKYTAVYEFPGNVLLQYRLHPKYCFRSWNFQSTVLCYPVRRRSGRY